MADTTPTNSLPQVAAVPVLGLPQQIIEVGALRQNDSVSVPLLVANRGAGGPDLAVALSADEPWVSLAEASITVAAGRSHSVAVQLAPTGDLPAGPFSVQVEAASDNAACETQGSVELRGRIVEDIWLLATPETLDLGQVAVSNEPVQAHISFVRSDGSPAQPRILEFAVEPTKDSPAALEEAAGTQQALHIIPRGESGFELEFHSANRKTGPIVGVLVVEDEDADMRGVRVPLQLTVIDAPRLHCSELQNIEVAGATGSVELALANTGNLPLEVAAEDLPTWLRATGPVTIAPGAEGALPLTFDLDGLTDETVHASLRLRSNDNGYENSSRLVTIALQRLWPSLVLDLSAPARLRAGESGDFLLALTNTGRAPAHAVLARVPPWLQLDSAGPVVIEPGLSETLTGRVAANAKQREPLIYTVGVNYDAGPGQPSQITGHVEVEVINRKRLLAGTLAAGVILLLLIGLLVLRPLLAGGGQPTEPRPPQVVTRPTPPVAPPAANREPLMPGTPAPPPVTQPAPPVTPAPVSPPVAEPPTPTPVDAAKAKTLIAQANGLKKSGKYPEAVRILTTEVLKADPKNQEATWVLAWTYAQLANKAKAVETFQSYLSMSSNPKRTDEARRAIARLGGTP